MSTPTTRIPPTFTNWRGRQIGATEIISLINISHDAALIIDNRKGILSFANSSLSTLTAFSNAELVGIKLTELIPDISIDSVLSGECHEKLLLRRNRDPLPVLVRGTQLDPYGQWVYLSLTPTSFHQKKSEELVRQTQLLPLLQQLFKIPYQFDIENTLREILKIGHDLLGSNYLCIYKAEVENPQLRKVVVWEKLGEDVLPDILSSSSLMGMQNLYNWTPATKALTDLHQHARKMDLAYVASAPLGQKGALSGLVVAADKIATSPDTQVLPIIEILASVITSALENFILVTNLEGQVQKYQQSLSVHEAILENSREGVIVLNKELIILEMNPSSEIILGYTSYEVKNQPAGNILIGKNNLTPVLEAAFQRNSITNLGDVVLHKRNGHAFLANIQVVPFFENDNIQGGAIFILDVSENEQIRLQTQQLEQRAILGEVNAIFAHEVRNPINNISTGLQLMESTLALDDKNRDVIARLQQDCTRLTHLMESVLAFSRPMEYTMEPVDLALLLQNLIERWRPRLARLKIETNIQVAPDTPKVNGNPRALEQVFVNLVSNASQAMGETGGFLVMKIQALNVNSQLPEVEVTVSDTGPGIPEEIRDHIFEPFITTSKKGTGLGLAITKRIVVAHKGTISVNSVPGGTVFMVRLPIN
jgi:two-component system sensor histidine kinase AtoS